MDKIALIFPGQGSQYIGMAKKLFNNYDVVKDTFAEASEVLKKDFSEMIFNGSLANISRIDNALTAIFIVSVAYYRVYMEEIGIVPTIVAGHSLGEYSALTCSGVISFKDALEIVQYRANLAKEVTEINSYAMSIVDNINKSAIEEICKNNSNTNGIVTVSCYNSNNQFAISGNDEALRKAEDDIFNIGGQVTPLFGSSPFHSSLMKDASKKLDYRLKDIKFRESRWPIISNVTGKPFGDKSKVKELLVNQLIKPVKWSDTIEYFENYGVTMVIEMGPKNVLSKLMDNYNNNIKTYSFDQIEDRERVIDTFRSDERFRSLKPTVVSKCLAAAVATPNVNWNEREYREGVVISVSKLKELHQIVELGDREPTYEMMKDAINLLKKVMITKGVSRDEQEEWLNEIFDDTSTQYILK
ncbi:hypothetical protein GCM10008904_21310 [Paraclostridium ghonii]|uniref:[acyl-carrier-protein] S-malonyltransferase n=1 Tax=Paraclostridium ghonii TaxID=29358 RepID=A0ABU0N0Y3_9FIRM|nr:ACP S-malonyltransferase [Paeniclostridium ghonii]MDQ0556523.1 [acyl-carrier-protein] S-malonyltransferase [Paeniclostridium ghonii]